MKVFTEVTGLKARRARRLLAFPASHTSSPTWPQEENPASLHTHVSNKSCSWNALPTDAGEGLLIWRMCTPGCRFQQLSKEDMAAVMPPTYVEILWPMYRYVEELG